MLIRPATHQDADAIWGMLEPVFRAGETYAIAPDITREDALAWAAKAKDAIATLPEHEIRGLLIDLADYVVARVN